MVNLKKVQKKFLISNYGWCVCNVCSEYMQLKFLPMMGPCLKFSKRGLRVITKNNQDQDESAKVFIDSDLKF
jgi:hypothetical protein